MGALIEIGVLGPVELTVDGAAVPLSGHRPRLLLCRLLVDKGQSVPAWRLRDDVWGEDHDGSDGVLKTAVSRLRATLGPAADSLRREGQGYALVRADVVTDADRFGALVDEARATENPLAAADLYGRALGLWRGEAFADVHDAPFLRAQIDRLERQRSLAEEDRFERLLAAGRHVELLPELQAAAAASPPRERVAMALALALYRSGHQVEALEALHDAARRLRDGHGVSPSAPFRQFEHALLTHDPALGVPAAPRTGPGGQDDVLAQIEMAGRGADALITSGAPGEAVRLATRAVDAARRSGDAGLLARTLARAARIASLAERGVDAQAHLDEAGALARRAADPVALAHVAMARFALGVAGDDGDGLLAALAEPLALLPPDAPECVDLLCAAMHQLVHTTDSPSADELLRRAELLAERAGEPRALAVARTARAVLAPLRGESLVTQRRAATAALEAVARSGDAGLQVVALHGRARTLLEAGRVAELDGLVGEFTAAAHRSPYPFAWLRAEMLSHTVDLARGTLDGVEGRIASSLARGQRMGVASVGTTTVVQFALCWMEQDRHAEMLAIVDARIAGRHGAVSPWDGLRVLLSAHLGELDAATRDLRQLCAARPWDGMVDPTRRFLPAFLIEAAQRLGVVDGIDDVAGALDADAGRFLVLGHATGTYGPADRLRGLARAAQGRLDEAVVLLDAAYALAVAGGAHLWADRTALDLAGVLTARGRAGDAVRAGSLVAAVAASPTVAASTRLARELAAVRA